MPMIGKVTLESVIPRQWGGVKAIFRCLYDERLPEDARFMKATPSGTIDFDIDNPGAISQLTIGKSYYVTFSETAPPPQLIVNAPGAEPPPPPPQPDPLPTNAPPVPGTEPQPDVS